MKERILAVSILRWFGAAALFLPLAVFLHERLADACLITFAVVGILGLFYVLGLFRIPWGQPTFKTQPSSLIVGTLGAVATFWLSTELGFGPFIGSGIVGILAARVLPADGALVAYTGAFAGMSLPAVTAYSTVIAAGVFVGLIYESTREFLPGVGGRLGTMAAAAVLIAAFIL